MLNFLHGRQENNSDRIRVKMEKLILLLAGKFYAFKASQKISKGDDMPLITFSFTNFSRRNVSFNKNGGKCFSSKKNLKFLT
jgi:hypothetical protein